MRTHYRVITTHPIKQNDTKRHSIYGIEAYTTKDGQNIVLDYISDIFPSLTKTEAFAKLCNDENLAIEHFRDAVQDAVEAEYII